jgi:DNA-binding protein H-NS
MTKTYLQIQKEIAALQSKAERLREQEAAGVAAKIREAIAVYGFSVADLFGNAAQPGGGKSKAARTRAPKPKYADGNGNAWGGRGPRPRWFKAAIESGKTPEDLLS